MVCQKGFLLCRLLLELVAKQLVETAEGSWTSETKSRCSQVNVTAAGRSPPPYFIYSSSSGSGQTCPNSITLALNLNIL